MILQKFLTDQVNFKPVSPPNSTSAARPNSHSVGSPFPLKLNLKKKNPKAELKHHDFRVLLPGNEEDDDRPPTPGRGLELVFYNAQEAKKKKQELTKSQTADEIDCVTV